MLSLWTSRQIGPTPTSDVAVKFVNYVLEKYTLMWILNSRQGCGLNRQLSRVKPTNNIAEAYHSHLNAEILCETSQHIHVYRCTEEGSANSVMLP